ncbi:MAG: 3-deoxy-D-manno-octulosonic acid transferase [Candidatus Latescibacteria bacterium]|nr:3-deoxy-D-manno-octulosonic acid transferase [Candidatus Latescibacterota bacterium]
MKDAYASRALAILLKGLYSITVSCIALFSVPYWLVRDGRGSDGWATRYGRVPDRIRSATDPYGCIWFHAASVGEVGVLARIMPSLMRLTPELPAVVTTVTSTGQNRARQLLGEQAHLLYLPLDSPILVRRAIRKLHPQTLIIAETELWPNLISQVSEYGAGIVLVNGRLSRSAFGRYRLVRAAMAPLLSRIDVLCVKSREDRERFIALGTPASSVHVTGDLKSEPLPGVEEATVSERRAFLGLPGDRPIFTAGSTRQGEETLLLDAYSEVADTHRNLLMVVAPRYPHRSGEVGDLLDSRGVKYLRRTRHLEGEEISDKQVLLLDTIGELEGFYAASDVAFVGGSLVPMGGHNVLEPALYGIPVLFGPHTGETGSADLLLLEAGGGLRIEGPGDLAASLLHLFDDESVRTGMGNAARRAVDRSRGALEQVNEYYSKTLGLAVRVARMDRGSHSKSVDDIAREPPEGNGS